MILFCDSSALVKLYLHEEETPAMLALAAASEMIAVCRIAWVEVMSAMARRTREQPGDATVIAQARLRFTAHWPQLFSLELTPALAELAGDYADVFALRAYDSVQLAAAHTAQREFPGRVTFACYDQRLLKAARVLGIGSEN